ncbi:zinc finger MYM-type protein 1-like [Sipha flava]|uniref:Zinc finger MYM-type protein 1-like n=1 Tax=Sipha flava TaxID=143950 RepID=A0A8B8GR15_9HEMI|nr:zinc finger MYM-type protein 1-like [Sipha flava]
MALKSVSSIVKFLKEYRQNGIPKVIIAAKDIALLIEIPGKFPEEYQFSQQNLELIYNKKLQEIYPNITTSLRIVLTIPVTVASAERSFSKLKLIKNHLRSTMSNERLTGLALLSIESHLAQELDLEDIVQDFASKKARKVNF